MLNERALIACAWLLCATSQPLRAQGLLHFLQDPDPDWSLGSSVGRLGDIDQDGVEDFAVSSEQTSAQTCVVRALSGKSAALVFEVPPLQPGSFVVGRALHIAACGDIDGDGRPDFAIGDPSAVGTPSQGGAASVHSGLDGSVLYVFRGSAAFDLFGMSVAGAGDVDADGRPDVIVGAMQYMPFGTAPGYADVYSGATGQLLHHWTGSATAEGFGMVVDGAGDVDGDGHADLVVGAGAGPIVRVFSGRTGALLHALDTQVAADSVAGGEDFDGDGAPDVVAGTINWDTPVGQGVGRVRAWSGKTGALIFEVEGIAPRQYLGTAVDGIADVDGDGLSDLLVGAAKIKPATYSNGGALVYPGLGGAPLLQVKGARTDEGLGSSPERLTALGDLDGDGRPEFGLSAPSTPLIQEGFVTIHSTSPLPPQVYCTPKVNSQGCSAVVSWTGTPSLSGADDFVLRCDQVLNQTTGVLLWSESPAHTPYLGGFLCLGYQRYSLGSLVSGGSTAGSDCTGVFQYDLTHRAMRALKMKPGTTICAQFVDRDPLHPDGSGAGFSGGVHFSVLP